MGEDWGITHGWGFIPPFTIHGTVGETPEIRGDFGMGWIIEGKCDDYGDDSIMVWFDRNCRIYGDASAIDRCAMEQDKQKLMVPLLVCASNLPMFNFRMVEVRKMPQEEEGS